MITEIEWMKDFVSALKRANLEEKPILLCFFNPGCSFCQQMDAVTYSNAEIGTFIRQFLIPVRVSPETISLFKQFHICWTPSLLVIGLDGREYHRAFGFFDPDQLIPTLQLGISKAHCGAKWFQQALEIVEALIRDYPQSDAVPEALFQRGIYRYKITLDHRYFQEASATLQSEYPANVWTKRARMLHRYPCCLSKWESCQEKRILSFESPESSSSLIP